MYLAQPTGIMDKGSDTKKVVVGALVLWFVANKVLCASEA